MTSDMDSACVLVIFAHPAESHAIGALVLPSSRPTRNFVIPQCYGDEVV